MQKVIFASETIEYMQKPKHIWGKYEGHEDQQLVLSGGFCKLAMKHLPGGWAVSYNKQAESRDAMHLETISTSELPENPHIFQTGRSQNLFIQPALPPKPVVFRNNKTVSIRQHQSIRIYLAVPLYIQLYYKATDADHLIAEYETERLTDTWFGEPDNGTPAFSVGSRFALSAADLLMSQHEVLVPVQIQNTSTQLLDLQRLLIRVDLMNLYQVGNQIISDLASIEFKGPGQTGNLGFSTDKAVHGQSPLLVAKSRQSAARNILGHSFHFIKQMTQL